MVAVIRLGGLATLRESLDRPSPGMMQNNPGDGSFQNGFDRSSRIRSPYVRPVRRRSPEISSTRYCP